MGIRDLLQKQGLSELRSRAIDAGLSYLIPLLGTAMTAASAFLPGVAVPWPYVMASSALVFMGLAVGVSYFQRLRTTDSPFRKLFVQPTGVQVLVKQEEIGKQNAPLIGIKYKTTIANMATFPIQFEIIPITVSLGNSFNPNPQREIKDVIANAGVRGEFTEAQIPVDPSMFGKYHEGKFDFRIKYGKPGKMRYSQDFSFHVAVAISAEGLVTHAEFSPRGGSVS